MTNEGWLKTLRFLCLAIGIGGAYVSAKYSVGGFTGYADNPGLMAAGVLGALLCIVLELAWRKPGMEKNLTMSLMGIFAYMYGIVTSFLGMMIASGISFNQTPDVAEWFQLTVYAIFAVLFEVSPEPLMTWGLTGNSHADLFGGIRAMINGDETPLPQYERKQQQRQDNRQNIPPEVLARLQQFQGGRRPGGVVIEDEEEFVPAIAQNGNHGQPTRPVNQPRQGGGKKNRNQFRSNQGQS